MRKTAVLALASCLLALPLKAADDESYALGAILSLSGSGSGYSQDGLKGIQLAVEEINAQGGLLGKHRIRLLAADSKTEPEAAAAEAARLIGQEKVSCIISDYSSPCAQAVKEAARKAKIIHLSSISNGEDLGRLDFSPYTFCLAPNTYMQAKALAIGVAKISTRKGWKSYVSVASNYEWGRSTQRNFVTQLSSTDPGLMLKSDIWIKQGETNFKPCILAIAKARPDFIYSCLGSDDNKAWLKAADEVHIFDKFASVGALLSVHELINQKDEIKRGVFAICYAPFFAHMDNKAMASFVERYRAANGGVHPSDWAVMSYDAVLALKQGAEKSGSTDPDKIKDALRGAQIETTRGTLKFREIDNQLECSSYLGFVADDPQYSFPVYKDILVVSGQESMRPEAEILSAREAAKKSPASAGKPKPK